jgi:S1-C subfamily serine protease
MSLATLAAFVALASTPDAVLVQFTSPSCQPCQAMQPALSRLISDGYPVQKIDVDRHPETAKQFGVRALPTFVLLVGNREAGRVEGATTYDRLTRMFADVAPAQADQRPAAAEAALTATQFRAASPDQAAVAASVRLKVEDAAGFGYGTGTIIDTHGDEALIVTCGHIFRESRGQGTISVDLFAPGATGPVEGHLLGYDLDRDIALVSIKPGMEIKPVAVAPPGFAVRPSDRVFTVGCDQGADASVRQSEITAVNKFRGRPTFSARGAPIDGRSGGGLFAADGQLIGVCNAADKASDEGLYAGLAAIHWQLDQIGQSEIYQRQADVGASTAAYETAAQQPDATPVAQAAQDPYTFASAQPQIAAPLERGAPAMLAPQLPAQMPAAFAATSSDPPLAGLGDDTELVVIIRSKRDPRVRSEIYVVDQASPDLLTGIVQAARRGASERAAAIVAQQPSTTMSAPRFQRGPAFAPQPVVRGQSGE